jgi:hypothetical protein
LEKSEKFKNYLILKFQFAAYFTQFSIQFTKELFRFFLEKFRTCRNLKKNRKFEIEYFLAKKNFQKISKKNSEIFQKFKKANNYTLEQSKELKNYSEFFFRKIQNL